MNLGQDYTSNGPLSYSDGVSVEINTTPSLSAL